MKSSRCIRVSICVCLGLVLSTLMGTGNAVADPVQRITFTADPFVTVNPCNESELLLISSQITLIEKDTIKAGSEHFLRQFLVESTVLNLTTGDIYQVVGHSTNIFHWPNEIGEPPLIYIFRSRSVYVQPGSGMRILFRETIRIVVNADGTTVFDVFDRVVSCR